MSKTAKTRERSDTPRRAAAHGGAVRQPVLAGTAEGAIHGSPRMTAQRRAMDAFGAVAQRVEEEEPIQGKFVAAQRVEEEEPLQGKFGTAQRVEEEEALQGKFDTAQRVEEEEPLQAKTADKAPNTTGMPDGLKSGIESMSGMDLSDVKVHRNSGKAADIQAHAYAQGSDIHVAPGQEKHLPHEAWHVVQQRQGRVKPTMQLKGVAVNDDVGLEQEADVMGAKAMQMASADPVIAQRVAMTGSGSVLQRDIDIPALSKKIQASRMEASQLSKEAKTPSEKDNIDLVWTKLSVLSGLIAQAADNQDAVKEAVKSFTEWTQGDGYAPWTDFQAAKQTKKSKEGTESTTAPATVTFSTQCEAVFSDMQSQYSSWNGKKRSRGAWWGSPGPGQTRGATSVPHDVIQELKSRVRGTRWVFSDSFSGGVSFHQTRGGIDFIYHMLPP